MAFNHENLKVYQRTLDFNASVSVWLLAWDHRHAVCDQLDRASSSVLENIAMASAAYSATKIRSLDYAIGSTLECAACLDLAEIKRLLDAEHVACEKAALLQILRMLVGLRKSWLMPNPPLREDPGEYSVSASERFHHENLDVYQLGASGFVWGFLIDWNRSCRRARRPEGAPRLPPKGGTLTRMALT